MSLLELSVDWQMRRFLFCLAENDSLPPADREQDKARQKCKRRGYVKYTKGHWHLTKAGAAAVDRLR